MSALLVRISPAQAPPTLVSIAGEIDIATATALRRHVSAVPDCHTVLELSDVRLLSAAGVTELVDLRDRLSRAAAHLAIAAAPRHVRKVLTITGLDDTVILAGTVDDAIHLITNTRRAGRHWVWRPRPGHAPHPAPALRGSAHGL